MKQNFTLKMPAFEFQPTLDKFNTGTLVSKTWKGVPPRERDRNKLPVLHTLGYFNAAFGAPLGNASSAVVEPSPYWGKQGTLLRPARSVVCNNTTLPPFRDLKGSAADMKALSDNRVLLARMNLENAGLSFTEPLSNYWGCLGIGFPWASRASVLMANGVNFSLTPTIDGSTFTGGEVLFLFMTDLNGSTGLPCYYDIDSFTPPDPAGRLAALLASDIAQVKAALGSFAVPPRWRLYGSPDSSHPADDDAYYGGVVAPACQAAGLDFTYTPGSGYSLAAVRNDYSSFFGI